LGESTCAHISIPPARRINLNDEWAPEPFRMQAAVCGSSVRAASNSGAKTTAEGCAGRFQEY
jgi:hypothetical protein